MHLADATLPLLSYGVMVAPDYDGCSDGCSEGGSTPLRTTESSASGEGAEGADDAPPLGVGGIEVPPLPPPVVQPLSPRLAFILSNIGVDPIDCVRSCDQASYMPEGVFGDDTEAIRGSALEYILVPSRMRLGAPRDRAADRRLGEGEGSRRAGGGWGGGSGTRRAARRVAAGR